MLGEGEIPVSPVSTSLNAVCMNKLVWLREAPVPKLWQRAGENAFVLSLREKTDVSPTWCREGCMRVLAQRGQETWLLATQEGSWGQRA